MRTSRLLLLLPLLLSCSSKLAPEGDEPGTCSDRKDNDEDALFDCDDPGCAADPDCVDGGDTDTDGGTGGGTGGEEGGGTGGEEGGGTGGEEGGGTGGEEGGGTGGGDGNNFSGTVQLTVTLSDGSRSDQCTGTVEGVVSDDPPTVALNATCTNFSDFGENFGLEDGLFEGELDADAGTATGTIDWHFMTGSTWTGTWAAPTFTATWSGEHTGGQTAFRYEGTLTGTASEGDTGTDSGEPEG